MQRVAAYPYKIHPMSKKIAPVTQSDFIKAYRVMLTSRVLEEKLAALFRAGMIKGGVFLGRGQEALSVSVGIQLRRGDIFAPLIRDQAGRLAFGDTVLDTLRTYLGSQLGSMRGRRAGVGLVHRCQPGLRRLPRCPRGDPAVGKHPGQRRPAPAPGPCRRRRRRR